MKNPLNICLIFIVLFSACSQRKKEINCATKDPEIICGNTPNIQPPEIFKSKCAICHRIDVNLTAPKLLNVLERVPSEQWFTDFVRNEDSLKKIKDPYTLEIEEWSPVDFRHNFKELDEKQLEEIKYYILNFRE